MSHNAVVMCGCCMGSIIIILGVLESVAWFLCYQICLDSATFGGNYYLGLVTGLLAIVVGILAITYLCLLHSYLVIVSLLVDVPLLFSSSICLIISAVNSTVERRDAGDGVVLLIAQSVLSACIALLSVIFAVQYCCIQNTSFNEEESSKSENQREVRRGPQRYNPYVDDDARSLPNGRFSEIPAVITRPYHVSQPTSTTPTGSSSNNPRYDRRNGGIHSNVNQPQPTDRVGRTANMYLGRRPSRGVNNRIHVIPNGRTPRHADDNIDTAGSLQSFNLGPILGNFDLRNSPDDLANGSSGHVNAGADDDNLPDFDLDGSNHNAEARYGDNSNFFF